MVGKPFLAFEDRIDQQARLLRAAAAEFDEFERPVEAGDDFAAVGRQQIAFDPGQIVLGQPRDGFEERRPEIVVEVFRGEAAWLRPQARADILGERRYPRRMRITVKGKAI